MTPRASRDEQEEGVPSFMIYNNDIFEWEGYRVLTHGGNIIL